MHHNLEEVSRVFVPYRDADLQPQRGQLLHGQPKHQVPPHTHTSFTQVPPSSYKDLTAAGMVESKIVFPGKFNKPLLSLSIVCVQERFDLVLILCLLALLKF